MNKGTDDRGKDDDSSERDEEAKMDKKRNGDDVRKYILKSVESPE